MIDAGITVLTGRSRWCSGAAQLLFGLAEVELTHEIGTLIGTSSGA